ncbi:hypothetical protein VP01_190g2, partial [Puccinia sorghi]
MHSYPISPCVLSTNNRRRNHSRGIRRAPLIAESNSSSHAMEYSTSSNNNQDMSRENAKRKPTAVMKKFNLIIRQRPDLDRFKPANGKIFDSLLASPYDSNTDDLDHPTMIEPTNAKKREPDTPKLSSSKKPKSVLESPQIKIESKPKISPRKKSPSKPQKKKPCRPPIKNKDQSPDTDQEDDMDDIITLPQISPKSKPPPKSQKKKSSRSSTKDKDQSPDPDEDEDIDDIALSDYSEPETKLRAREPAGQRRKFAGLRKARKMITKKKALTKEINSRRIVPDSDIEIEGDKNASDSNDKDSDDEDSQDSKSTTEGSGSGSEESSEIDEENFIVNDMSTEAEKKQVKRRIDLHMPHQFRVSKQDDMSHFKVACQFSPPIPTTTTPSGKLMMHFLRLCLSRRNRQATNTPEFNESCKHLDELFHAQAIITLEYVQPPTVTSSWTVEFRRELNIRPYITSHDYRHSSKGCGACHNQTKISKNFLRLTVSLGKPYSPSTLNPEQQEKKSDDSDSNSDVNCGEDDDDDESSDSGPPIEQDKQHKFKLQLIKITPKYTTVISGENCAERALEYHYFKHWKLYLMKKLRDLIEPLRDEESKKKRYKPTSRIPPTDTLKALKREGWEIFKKLDDPASSPFNKSSLERLYQQCISRLNKAKKKFGLRG